MPRLFGLDLTDAEAADIVRQYLSGAKRIKYRDREIEYDLAEMRQAVAMLNRQVKGAPTHRLATFGRGFGRDGDGE